MTKFTQTDVIRIIREKTGYRQDDLRKVLKALYEALIILMATAKNGNPTEIRLFSGFYLQARFEPERPARDPRTGEWIMARQKIKPNVQVSRWFKARIEREAGIISDENKENDIEGDFLYE